MSKLISIIVPVYKVEAYLDRCVTSLLNQTHTNIEVILVDDGSPDNSGEICDKYAKLDSRVKVVHKEKCCYVYCICSSNSDKFYNTDRS